MAPWWTRISTRRNAQRPVARNSGKEARSPGRQRLRFPAWRPSRKFLVLLMCTIFAGCSMGPKDAAGQRLFERACGQCHKIKVPLSKRNNVEGWRRIIWGMRQRGAKVTDEEAERIAVYLSNVRGKE